MHRLAKHLLKRSLAIDATYADNCGIQSMGADGVIIKSDNYIVLGSSSSKLAFRSSRYNNLYKRSYRDITISCFLIPTKLSFFLPVSFLLRDMFIYVYIYIYIYTYTHTRV